MKKEIYQKPALTVVSFRVEKGFAQTGDPSSSNFSALFGDGENVENRGAVDDGGSGWASGW